MPVRVRQILPSGDLFIEGTKIVMVGHEEKHIYLSGIVRRIVDGLDRLQTDTTGRTLIILTVGLVILGILGWVFNAVRQWLSAEAIGNVIVAVLGAVRKKKSEGKLSMKVPVKKLVIETDVPIEAALFDLKTTTYSEKIEKARVLKKYSPDLRFRLSCNSG